jgi:hypothetical protein
MEDSPNAHGETCLGAVLLSACGCPAADKSYLCACGSTAADKCTKCRVLHQGQENNRSAGGSSNSIGAQKATRWVWRAELQHKYVELLKSADNQRVWDHIQQTQMTANEAVSAFMEGLGGVVQELDNQCGRVISVARKEHTTTTSHVPMNGWYNTECKQAHKVLKNLSNQHGERSHPAREARAAYRTCIRRAKAQHKRVQADSLLDQIWNEPKRFWKTFQGKRTGNSAFESEEWTSYYQELYDKVKAGGYEGGSVKNHCAHFPDLFPEASAEAMEAAAVLNKDITEEEVCKAIASLLNGKAAGVEGMPAEWLKHAVELRRTEGGGTVKVSVLAPVITKVFNTVLQNHTQHSAGEPVPWCRCQSQRAG